MAPGYYPPAGPATPKQMGKEALALRIVAIIIDGIIIGIIAYLLNLALTQIVPWAGLLNGIFSLILLAVYMMVMEGSKGQTIGKMLLNLKVVREDGGPITMKEAQTRALAVLLWILIIPILLDLIWVADEGQRLGDKWAHTTVIKVA